MNLFLDKLSFRYIFSLSVVISFLLIIPLTVFSVKQKTKLSSNAYAPPQFIKKTNQNFGHLPSLPPQIYRAYPWIGKIGDTIWIQGKNFGNNPYQKQLKIGNIIVFSKDIDSWQDDQIQFSIPNGVSSSIPISLKIGNYPSVATLPVTIYDKNTTLKINKHKNILIFKNQKKTIKKIKIWLGDENTPFELLENTISNQTIQKTITIDTKNKPILNILLLDTNNKPLPYYVNPLEFDF